MPRGSLVSAVVATGIHLIQGSVVDVGPASTHAPHASWHTSGKSVASEEHSRVLSKLSGEPFCVPREVRFIKRARLSFRVLTGFANPSRRVRMINSELDVIPHPRLQKVRVVVVDSTSPSRNEKRAATGVRASIGRGEPLVGWRRRRSRIWCYTGGWRCIAHGYCAVTCVRLAFGQWRGRRHTHAICPHREMSAAYSCCAPACPARMSGMGGGIKVRHWRPPVGMDRRDWRRTCPCFAPGCAMTADPRPPAVQDGRLPECVQEALLQEGCYAFFPKTPSSTPALSPTRSLPCALPLGNRPGAAPTARRC